MMKDETHIPAIKRIYAQHAGMKPGGDPSRFVKKTLNEREQVAFLKEIWKKSRNTYNSSVATKDVEQSAEMAEAE